MQDTDNDNTSKDIAPTIYYTTKDKNIYLFAASWKAAMVNAKSLMSGKVAVKKVSLLGTCKKVKWTQSNAGLQIEMPSKLPGTTPIYVFKVALK